jgi:hypothetical protein
VQTTSLVFAKVENLSNYQVRNSVHPGAGKNTSKIESHACRPYLASEYLLLCDQLKSIVLTAGFAKSGMQFWTNPLHLAHSTATYKP